MKCGIFSKKDNKLWLWKAVAYPGGDLLDWEVGPRDTETFERLFSRLETRFSPSLYCADDLSVYRQVIPPDRLCQGKSVTHTVESHHSNTRHWFSRFKRKSKAVSRCPQMVDLTLKLDASRRQFF